MTNDNYKDLVDHAKNLCGKEGIDKVLDDNGVDILMGPGDGPLFTIFGTAGEFEQLERFMIGVL